MKDTFRHKGLRKRLTEELQQKGILDKNVLAAIQQVPRHFFLDTAFVEQAYLDKAFPIGQGQTISQPYTVAYQTELLEVKEGEKVLEIGTGSGYQTCILYEMGAEVFSIERHKELYIESKKFLSEIGVKAKLFLGDGSKGLPTFAPYDKILVTAGAPNVSDDLVAQLKVGGTLVIPVGDNNDQIMVSVLKISETNCEYTEHAAFKFVPLIGDKAW